MLLLSWSSSSLFFLKLPLFQDLLQNLYFSILFLTFFLCSSLNYWCFLISVITLFHVIPLLSLFYVDSRPQVLPISWQFPKLNLFAAFPLELELDTHLAPKLPQLNVQSQLTTVKLVTIFKMNSLPSFIHLFSKCF